VILPFILTQLVSACAPRIGRLTMSAIVMYESGARPNAISDNTARHAYFLRDRSDAERLATGLLAVGHNIDVGYAQLNSGNFRNLGLDVHRAFEPCANIAAGAHILEAAYVGAARRYGSGQPALVHALSAYNTGGYWAGLGYASGVYATAAGLRSGGSVFGPTGKRAVMFHARRPRRLQSAS